MLSKNDTSQDGCPINFAKCHILKVKNNRKKAGTYRDKIMADKLIYISPMMLHKIILAVDFNQLLGCLDTQFKKLNNEDLIKVLKVVKPTNKKTLL